MKIRAMILSCLIGVAVLFMGAEFRGAEPKVEKSCSKIGVVSVRKIFQECKRTARYKQEVTAERDRVFAGLAKLKAEIEAEEAGLRTLKAGSSDHLASMKEILVKQANFQAQQEFHKQQMVLKQQKMIEDIYGDILRITGEVAEQKGLDLVFEKSEPELPASSASELERTMGTHKLLYSSGCLDITDEVMARLNEENSKSKNQNAK